MGKEEVDLQSADKKAEEIGRRLRKAELDKQRRRRELNRAIHTLKVLEGELTETGSGQAEYYVDSEVKGLEQMEGETNDSLYERAAGICRAHGLSAEEVSERVLLSRDSRLNTSFQLGDISSEERDDRIIQLSSEIAYVYKSLSEKK